MGDSEQLIRELSERPVVEGVTMMDILDLPDSVRPMMKEMIRGSTFTHGEMCEHLAVGANTASQVIDLLVHKGYVQTVDAGELAGAADAEEGEPVYRVALSPIRGRPIGDEFG